MIRNRPTRFPDFAENGQQIADVYGNVYKYNSLFRSWTKIGRLTPLQLASEQTNGLVPVELYPKLQSILENVPDSGIYETLKIYPGLDAYWYRLYSSDSSFRFYVENDSDLRIEIDQARLLHRLSRHICPGSRGPVGITGRIGRPGRPGTPESRGACRIEDGYLLVETQFDYDIDTPISFRIFRTGYDVIYSEFLIDFESGEPALIGGIGFKHVDFDASEINCDISNKTLYARIAHKNAWADNEWLYGIGQIGQMGPQGPDGSGLFTIIKRDITEQGIINSNVVTDLSLSPSGDILYRTRSAAPFNCAYKFVISSSNACDTGQFALSRDYYSLMAVKRVAGQCKPVDRFSPIRPNPITGVNELADVTQFGDEFVPLNLASWAPTPTCWQRRHWSSSKFDWVSLTNVPKSEIGWLSPNSPDLRDPTYPFGIKAPNQPGERHCQDDFFFCANIADKTLPIVDSNGETPIIQAPAVTNVCCDCECPIELQVQRGYEFNDITIDSDGRVLNCDGTVSSDRFATCTLNGGRHIYKQNIVISDRGSSDSVVRISFRLSYSDDCDESREATRRDRATRQIPSFSLDCLEPPSESECRFKWAVEAIRFSGDLSVVSGPEYIEKTGPNTVTVTIGGKQGIAELAVYVNTNALDCCQAYGISSRTSTTTINDDTIPIPPTPAPQSPSLSPSASVSMSPSDSPSPSTSIEVSPSFSVSPSISASPSPSLGIVGYENIQVVSFGYASSTQPGNNLSRPALVNYGSNFTPAFNDLILIHTNHPVVQAPDVSTSSLNPIMRGSVRVWNIRSVLAASIPNYFANSTFWKYAIPNFEFTWGNEVQNKTISYLGLGASGPDSVVGIVIRGVERNGDVPGISHLLGYSEYSESNSLILGKTFVTKVDADGSNARPFNITPLQVPALGIDVTEVSGSVGLANSIMDRDRYQPRPSFESSTILNVTNRLQADPGDYATLFPLRDLFVAKQDVSLGQSTYQPIIPYGEANIDPSVIGYLDTNTEDRSASVIFKAAPIIA